LAEGRMTAIAACRICGTEPLESARFCPGCGSPVQDGDTRAEYQQVMGLFADVVHSMDIPYAVGAERLRDMMAEAALGIAWGDLLRGSPTSCVRGPRRVV
jgi:hypothetical protein